MSNFNNRGAADVSDSDVPLTSDSNAVVPFEVKAGTSLQMVKLWYLVLNATDPVVQRKRSKNKNLDNLRVKLAHLLGRHPLDRLTVAQKDIVETHINQAIEKAIVVPTSGGGVHSG